MRAKTTIDNVYAEMRNQGVEIEPERPRTHSRVASKTGAHYRNVSGQGALTAHKGMHKPLPSDKKKNALVKESEYGVLGIKAPLIEVAVKAEEIWGPALGGREKEDALRLAMDSLEKSQEMFSTCSAITDCIKRKDYESLVEEYSRARKYVDQAREMANAALDRHTPLTEPQIHQIVMTGRIWSEVEDRINSFKRTIWRKLADTQGPPSPTAARSPHDEYMALIGILLELGVDDNPIWVWLLSRYDHLKNRIQSTFERARMEIEFMRRRLANAEEPTPQIIASQLKTAMRQQAEDRVKDLDIPAVIELWDLIYASMCNLLSPQGGILGEVLDFWNKVQMFMDGKVQKTLPAGIDGQSRVHHRLSADGSRQLQDGVMELIEILRGNVFSFFADPPIEDISMLYSPISPQTPYKAIDATRSPFGRPGRPFMMDAHEAPPPSPKRGEVWEDFAFWPPYANSLSATHYLGKLLTLLGGAASEIVSIHPPASGAAVPEKLKSLLAGTRERCVRAACAAWDRDAEMCKILEDWIRSTERRELTTMPAYFNAFESAVLSGMQKILYIPDIASTSRSFPTALVSPPPSKLLQIVRSQFVTTLYKTLSGMVENAEKPVLRQGGIEWTAEPQDTLTKPTEGVNNAIKSRVCPRPLILKPQWRQFHANTSKPQETRLLLTLSNLKTLQADIIPQLINQFETHFSVKLTSESQSIHSVLTKIDSTVFKSYTGPISDQLSILIHNAISSPPPVTRHPTDVRPYVTSALLLLVSTHAHISTTTPQLTVPILSALLEHLCTAFLAALSTRAHDGHAYTLPELMQTTLDVEFAAQTLSQYTTPRASEIQNEIYVQLDRGAEPEAKIKSQMEVREIGTVLKRLREGTRNEFACFKTQQRVGGK